MGKKSNSVLEELVNIIGVSNTRKLMTKMGGRTIYIPKRTTFLTHRRNMLITYEYKSGKYTLTELAKRWDLTLPTIYEIVQRMSKGSKTLDKAWRKVIKD